MKKIFILWGICFAQCLSASESLLGAGATLGAPKLVGRPITPDKAANPAMSLTGLVLSSQGSGVPMKGFSLQEVAAQFSGAVDSYFYGNLTLFTEGSGNLRVREVYASTLFLPKLAIKAGKFLLNFGANHIIHPKAQPLIDRPLVNRYFWGDNVEGALGLEVSWRLPLPWHADFIAAFTRAQNATTMFTTTNPEVLSSQGRFENLFALGTDTVLGIGFSGATGRGGAGAINYWGTDLTLKVGSSKGTDSAALSWTNEVISRGKNDWGIYSTPLVRMADKFWLGGRLDYVERITHTITSENILLAYAPSDFSMIRSQFGWSQPSNGEKTWQALLQFGLTLGSHSLHAY